MNLSNFGYVLWGVEMETIKRILNENKSLKILIPVLGVAFILLIIIYAQQKPTTPVNNSSTVSSEATADPSANVLPSSDPTAISGEISTDFSSGTSTQTSEKSSADSSLIGPPEFKGAIRGARGVIALLQFSNVTKQVKIGDTIAGYTIKSIADDDSNITLEKNDLISVLQISPNSN